MGVFCKARERSIPTCVGTTNPHEVRYGEEEVHPHVRGDYAVRLGVGFGVNGPSPRAWGLLLPILSLGSSLRSIPTCVGTTGGSSGLNGFKPVHPHVRGDYLTSSYGTEPITGPSPRAWGLRLPPALLTGLMRSIPTCVGTTASFLLPPPPPRSIPTCVGTTNRDHQTPPPTAVHPHVRGDYPRPPAYS